MTDTDELLDVFGEIDALEELARSALDTPMPTRLCVLRGGEIVVETTNEQLARFVFEGIGDVCTREELVHRDPAIIERWNRSERVYLSAIADDGTLYVDVAYGRFSGGSEPRVTADVLGGGKVRTRREMLNDPEWPGLADALGKWEALDDSASIEGRRRWAQRILDTIADRRAKDRRATFARDRASLRLGTPPPP